ncbi:hypothetical protein [Hafnia paralvei]|uniref:hypothetical protein n=1 Tax=Hafnia paralvei TaxID=546367 RepID=UPI001034B6E4|nr:hypothetical protein [Hafnia paralvei]TBL62451.1 hypothetical protein EYY97_09175 [Hafnia paralvei]
MSMSDTNQARRYASIAEVAAAQAKISADKLDGAPAYAEQAAASASAAANSAQAAISAEIVVSGIAAQANQSAISAAESAAQAGDAAGAAIGRSLRVPEGELLSELPEASSRANTVPIFDVNSNAATKNISEFAIIDSVSGKLPVSIIPSVALTVPFVVSNQEEMLALSAQVGDVAKRTDLGYSFMLGADPASTLSNWVQLTDNVLTQLSQSSGASMIGAKDDADNPTTVQQLLDAKANTATLSANAGATTIGATNLSGGGVTVQQSLDSLNQSIAALTAKDGFNLVGRFLNLSELRAKVPAAAGQIVYVASAASATATEKHYGGGYFQSFDNSTSPIADDGGIVIVPATGTLAWRRINFTDVELVFWGVKPDTGLDFSSQILKAMTYIREKKCKIKFPIGVITSNDALPIWSESTIEGHGRAASKFIKLTNNGWNVSAGVSIDAICVCLPDVYDRYGGSMDTFCVRPRISGISLERVSTTPANKPAYGIWGFKLAGANFSDMLVLGGNIGFYANIAFLMIQEQVSYSGSTGSYAGVYIANPDPANIRLRSAGTTCYFKQVGVGGYGFGFYLAKLNSTRLVQCDAEALSRATGETECAAYLWLNPENCTMDNCYTESVDGAMIKVSNANDISISNNLVITGMNISGPNPSESFSQPTRLITIDSVSAGTLKVTFIGGDLRFALPGFTNMLPSLASGSNCEVKLLGAIINQWDVGLGATITQL